MKKAIFLLLAASLFAAGGRASAEPGPELLRRQWDARWIELPGSDPDAYGAYIFRKVRSRPDYQVDPTVYGYSVHLVSVSSKRPHTSKVDV